MLTSNLDELASIVTVRNHIHYLVNHERHLLPRYKDLDNVRIKLDKLFIDKCMNLDDEGSGGEIRIGGNGDSGDVIINGGTSGTGGDITLLAGNGTSGNYLTLTDGEVGSTPETSKKKPSSKKQSKKKTTKKKKSKAKAASGIDPEIAARIAEEKRLLSKAKGYV